MATNQRKGHVVRITNGGRWIDVLRIDYIWQMQHAGAQGRGFHLHWEEKLDGTGQVDNPGRVMEDVAAYDTGGNFVANIPAIKKLRMNNSGQRQVYTFKNKPTNSVRKGLIKRLSHTPVSLDPTHTKIDWDDYKAELLAGTPAATGQIDVEIPHRFATKQQQGYPYQGARSTIKGNVPLSQMAMYADVPDGATGTPLRLDPFQVVVNISGDSASGSTANIWVNFYVGESWQDIGPSYDYMYSEYLRLSATTPQTLVQLRDAFVPYADWIAAGSNIINYNAAHPGVILDYNRYFDGKPPSAPYYWWRMYFI